VILVHETPALYKQITLPYILAFPASRTQWVYNILNGISEQSSILYSCSDFLILPDMKWDLHTLNALYLVAIVQTKHKNIRSIRDLRVEHIPLLKSIKKEASKVVKDKWGIGPLGLRLFVHYQPSYCTFSIPIVLP
jgi:m7GpppX diphosphatase